MHARWQLVSAGTVGPDALRARRMRRANAVGWVIGILAAFGLLLVASFQSDRVNSVHGVGAAMTFGGGLLYGLIHSWLSYRLGERSWILRLALVVVGTTSILLSLLAFDGRGYFFLCVCLFLV